MGIEINFYIGPVIKVKTIESKSSMGFLSCLNKCNNNGKELNSLFCPLCGNKNEIYEVQEQFYLRPTTNSLFYEQKLDDLFYDVPFDNKEYAIFIPNFYLPENIRSLYNSDKYETFMFDIPKNTDTILNSFVELEETKSFIKFLTEQAPSFTFEIDYLALKYNN